MPDGSEDALEERTEEMEPSSETVTRLKDYDVPTEPPNQNAVREARTLQGATATAFIADIDALFLNAT